MNKKNLIRLTEADLHRIVRESVNKVLNEVEYDGKSYHGYYGDSPVDKRNAAIDWMRMSKIRDNKAKELYDASDKAFGNGDEKWYEPAQQGLRNGIHGGKNYNNAYEILHGIRPRNASHFDKHGMRKW